MPLPESLTGRLKIPVIAAPMFLVSGPDLVVGACQCGVLGSFPALNQRTTEGYAEWLAEIGQRLAPEDAPFGVNLVVHRSNPRLEADLRATIDAKVPVVITSLGAVDEVVQAVQSYGGVVFHDVTGLHHARKAIAAGVDGLIAVAAGAGGHAGPLSPFAFVQELRRIFDGAIILGGAIGTGAQVAAARVLGADLAYVGTRFIASHEALARPEQKLMVVESGAEDVVYTSSVSGVPGNFLRKSLLKYGRDPDAPKPTEGYDFGTTDAKAWKHLWAAGQGVGSIHAVTPVADICADISAEYGRALRAAPGMLTNDNLPAPVAAQGESLD
jgi:nitronate monooxygenase